MKYKKNDIVLVDGISVQIDSIDENVMKCHTIEQNKTKFVAYEGEFQASGRTERSAKLKLRRKIFNSKTEEERINEFIFKYKADEKHTADEWVEAHQLLTGSCGRGAWNFLKKMDIRRYDTFTTMEFLDIVDGAYGGDIISKVKRHYTIK